MTDHMSVLRQYHFPGFIISLIWAQILYTTHVEQKPSISYFALHAGGVCMYQVPLRNLNQHIKYCTQEYSEVTKENHWQVDCTQNKLASSRRLINSLMITLRWDQSHHRQPIVIICTGVLGCEGQSPFNSTIKKQLRQYLGLVEDTQMNKKHIYSSPVSRTQYLGATFL